MSRIKTRPRVVAGLLIVLGAAAVLATLFLVLSPFGGDDGQSDLTGWPPPPDVVERGQTIYRAQCAACHGQNGEGEPNWTLQNADGTYPAPPHDSSGHTWHHPDGQLFEIVRDGGAQFESGSFRSRMPAWGETLTDEEIRAVLTYLKTLWGPDERAFQAEVSERDPFPTESP